MMKQRVNNPGLIYYDNLIQIKNLHKAGIIVKKITVKILFPRSNY